MQESEIIGETLNTVLRAAVQKLPDKEMDAFAELKTHEERLTFVLKRDYIHDLFGMEKGFAEKEPDMAKHCKEEGNKFFKQKSYMAALECYNYSIMKVPWVEDSTELSLVFANRSASLLHLRRYQMCLDDIEYAFDANYPVDMRYKLHDRQGKCWIQLKQPEKAKASFNAALESFKDSKLDEAGLKLWTSTINKQLEQCEKVTPEVLTPKEKVLPHLASTNEKFPHASDALELRCHTDKEIGRYMVANKAIRVGSVLMDEKPFASVLLPDCYHSHCYHCKTRTKLPLPCTKCSNIMFCTKACREAAWSTYLAKEYEWQDLLADEWCAKFGHLAVRVAMVMGYEKLKQFMLDARQAPQVEQIQKGMTPEGVYTNDYRAIYSMETNPGKRLPEGIFDFTVFAVFLLKILQGMGFFEAEKATKIDATTRYSEELVLIGSALLQNLQVLQCNAHGISELQQSTDFENPKPMDIGIGIYTTSVLINHSCDPNCDLNFFGNQLFVRATRSIKPNEEITIDYGVLFYRDPVNTRLGKLSYRYCFQCSCEACKEEWPLWQSIEAEIPLFSCQECHRWLEMGGKIVDNAFVKCKKCNYMQNVQEIIGILQVQHDVYAASMAAAVDGKGETVLANLEDYMQLMQKFLMPPWRDLVSCQAAIRNIYRLRGNIRMF